MVHITMPHVIQRQIDAFPPQENSRGIYSVQQFVHCPTGHDTEQTGMHRGKTEKVIIYSWLFLSPQGSSHRHLKSQANVPVYTI